MPLIERLVRMGLSIGSGIERIVGTKQLQSVTHLLSKILPFRIPQWGEFIPRPLRKSIPSNIPENPEYLYLPSCLSRVFGDERMKSATRTVPEILATLAARAKIPLKIAPSEGTCCGTPFSSKGYHDAYNLVFENFINTCFKHSQEGKLPIVLDTTPCTYNVKTTSVSALSPQTKERYAALRFLDSVEFISEVLLPRLKPRALETSVTIHPVCSLEKLNLTDTLRTLMRQCATRVEVPLNAGCCGFAGDRGLLVPELTESATKEEAKEVRAGLYERHCSSCKTCEIALSRGVGKQYQSYLHIVEEATR